MSSLSTTSLSTPLSARFDRFEDMFRRMMRPLATDNDWAGDIRVDVIENDKEYQVRAAVPGVKKDDIQVSIDRNCISISTDAKPEKEAKSGNGYRTLVKEIYQNHASREMSLLHEVDDKAAVAKVEDGILTLTLPKRKDAHSKVLRIQ
ncbi:MAG: Hsp20/alpha crystallin family protein [Rhodoferax sp.]|nr:Hsp20/alpha crystallin family protein [Rhodoferax sp.]MDP3650353.1 Hsp20/alpha crystallin family protein [Rhodoferax sp.]